MASRDDDDFLERLGGAMVSNGMGGHAAPNPFAQAAIRNGPGGGGGGGGVGSRPGKAVGRSTRTKSQPAPQSNPLIDAMLGLLGGSGGTGGGSWVAGYNGAAARRAAQAAYDSSVGNTRNVYGQIVGAVTDRNPAIVAGYQAATDAINADAAARVAGDQARAAEADQRNAATAAALGLNEMPVNAQADALQQAGQNAYQANAQAWTGFNGQASQLATERNNAVGDAFRYAGTQTETQLAAMLQQALAQIAGQEASNPGYYSGGGGGGGASFNDQFKVLNALLGYDMDQQKLAASSAGKGSPLASISPGGWAAIQQAYGGGVVSGSQGNAAALAGLANNPRDFALLYSTLYG